MSLHTVSHAVEHTLSDTHEKAWSVTLDSTGGSDPKVPQLGELLSLGRGPLSGSLRFTWCGVSSQASAPPVALL